MFKLKVILKAGYVRYMDMRYMDMRYMDMRYMDIDKQFYLEHYGGHREVAGCKKQLSLEYYKRDFRPCSPPCVNGK